MKTFYSLTRLYAERKGLPVAIAHRGACGSQPENTIPAMELAWNLGADIIEFDLRMTKDGVPVLLHDEKLDRTSNGTGVPEDYTLEEIKQFDFSKRNGKLGPTPVQIPTFEEILQLFRGKVGMNIQVYANRPEDLETIVSLYRKYEMYDQGFMALDTFAVAEIVHGLDPRVDYSIMEDWEHRGYEYQLRRCKEAGARFAQPVFKYIQPNTIEVAAELGLHANFFYADQASDIRYLAEHGAQGILTNRIDILTTELTAMRREQK